VSWFGLYKYRKKLTFNELDIEKQTDFSTAIFVNEKNFPQDSLDNIFQNPLNKVKFYASDDTSVLAFKVVKDEPENKNGILHVKVPHMNPDGISFIWMYYGLSDLQTITSPIRLVNLWETDELVLEIYDNGFIKEINKKDFGKYYLDFKKKGSWGGSFL